MTAMSEQNIKPSGIPDDILELLAKHLQRIQFGSVSLIIQNGKVVQIESTEKIRTEKK